jgi:hypothetical protein
MMLGWSEGGKSRGTAKDAKNAKKDLTTEGTENTEERRKAGKQERRGK